MEPWAVLVPTLFPQSHMAMGSSSVAPVEILNALRIKFLHCVN